jgi:alkylation response protein AidB-like acyl-CoA dehydrogenase
MGTMTDIAMELRETFDKRAVEADLTASLPAENYEEMADSGYLKGPVPGELGGLDSDLVEVSRAQRALGWGCASTALAVNMHLFQVGAAGEGFRAAGKNEGPLRRVAEESIVLGSTAAEAVVAGSWDTPTTATRDGDDYIVSGRKFFFSQSHVVDLVRVNARDVETGEILVLAVPMSAPGVSIIDTWDTLGMRGTASNDLVLDDVRVPESAIGARLSPEAPAWDPAFANVIKWFLVGMTSVYVGIADRAREAAFSAMGGGFNSSHRDQALTDAMVGDLEVAHLKAAATLEHTVRRIQDLTDPIEALRAAIAMKEVCTNAAVEVVDAAVAIVGGKAFHRKSILERLARDVRAARHHPPSAPAAQQMIGIAHRGGPDAGTARS